MAWSWEKDASLGARRTVSHDGVKLATLVPISSSFEAAPGEVTPGRAYVLPRFAYTRAEAGEVVLESPLAQARIVLHDWRATAIVHVLARPQRLEDLSAQAAFLPSAAIGSLIGLLLAAGIVLEQTANGASTADEPPTLRSWEFHDLLFHARSRGGRHDQPTGSTYRLADQVDPPAVLKAMPSGRSLELFRPDLARLQREDPPFAQVLEARRSIRDYGAQALTERQLGEFLYRVGRVADYWDGVVLTPRGPAPMATAARPYPSAGGLYELELYVVVNRCHGVEAGLYHYDPERHRLSQLRAMQDDLDALLGDASMATAIPRDQLQVLIVIAARFQRLAWTYASIAYSLILKDVGVLYQTMYLAATAMGLAPCAAGCGNADLFARAAGTDYYAETSVGEFLLGSRAADDPPR